MGHGLGEHIGALEKERARLDGLLEADETWRALAARAALEARGGGGEGRNCGETAAEKARLEGILAANLIYRARAKIDEAITLLFSAAAGAEAGLLSAPPAGAEAGRRQWPLAQPPPLPAHVTAAGMADEARAPEIGGVSTAVAESEAVPDRDSRSLAWPFSKHDVAEARVTIVAREIPLPTFADEPGSGEAPAPAGSLRDRLRRARDFDAAGYAAYHGTVEEASVEIVLPTPKPE